MAYVELSQSDLGKLPSFDGKHGLNFSMWTQLMLAAFRRCRLSEYIEWKGVPVALAPATRPGPVLDDAQAEDELVRPPRRVAAVAAARLFRQPPADHARILPGQEADDQARVAAAMDRARDPGDDGPRRAIFDMLTSACKGVPLVYCLRAAGPRQDGVLAWGALMANYARRDPLTVQRLHERLLDRVCWQPDDTMDTYADAVMALDYELTALDVGVPFAMLRMNIFA